MAFDMKGSTFYGKGKDLKLNRGGYENLSDGRSKGSMYQKKKVPTWMKEVGEGFKVIGRTLKPSKENIVRHASDIKEGFRQLVTGSRTDSRKKKKK
tara:strand:+ start:1099 stop:1386 length:288 start_codon:yes stop_codon:yes gene_type:complete